MAKVSVTEAARLAGIGRQHLYRGYISTGKISVERDHLGKPQIDTAEIIRVFGELKATEEETQKDHEETIDNFFLDNRIRHYIEAKDETIAALRTQLEEAKDRESWLRSKLDALEQKLLTGPETKRRWWWLW
ncbi:MAG: hypothetical protein K0041_09605 [Acidithiobacillus sp.]|nr:hypothetical protein [Acidithiobacillus sp.]